ncbi:hypothetical protein GcM3_127018 [Golovinomyces cichoracearum]|uniref:Uncharacterized protein n=1 Tax=Golovinomyces cichoracearum TaxID=62708 RepID=A0A420I5V8_9PEZI|nr:hypothetical protein GcM3_127018 [Golovinomyces cichoracearum]
MNNTDTLHESHNLPSDVFSDFTNLSANDLQITLPQALTKKSHTMANTRRQSMVTKQNKPLSKPKSKNQNHKSSKPQSHADPFPQSVIPPGPVQSIGLESEISSAETQIQDNHDICQLTQEELRRRLEQMEKILEKLNSQLLNMKKSHHDLATEVVKLQSELNSHTRTTLVLNKGGTIRKTAREVLAANHNPPQLESSSRTSVQPVDRNTSEVSNILVGVLKRPSRLMD